MVMPPFTLKTFLLFSISPFTHISFLLMFHLAQTDVSTLLCASHEFYCSRRNKSMNTIKIMNLCCIQGSFVPVLRLHCITFSPESPCLFLAYETLNINAYYLITSCLFPTSLHLVKILEVYTSAPLCELSLPINLFSVSQRTPLLPSSPQEYKSALTRK